MKRNDFDRFARAVAAHGLTALDRGNGHWQATGGQFLVNLYPFAKDGPTLYVNGTHAGKRYLSNNLDACVAECVAAAQMIPERTTDKTTRPKHPKHIRRRLHQRLGDQCRWCGKTLTLQESTLDHIIPVSRGGSNGLDNLCLACVQCNHDRGDVMPEISVVVAPGGK